MPTIFGKDKDAIVAALRQCCSKRETGCINCPYNGRCYDLHPDAVYLAERLVKALEYFPRDGLLNTLKHCDTCSTKDEQCCIFHRIHSSKACDKVQLYMADYIEWLYSKFMKKCPSVSRRPFYINVNGHMEEISEIDSPYSFGSADYISKNVICDIKPTLKDLDDKLDALQYSLYVGRCNGKTALGTKLTTSERKLMNEIVKEENKNVDTTLSIWKNYLGLIEAEEHRRMETHFTPKSIEQSADHRTVVVIWTDNTKTIVRLSPNDPDDIYMAFTAALAKKIFRSNSKIKKVISTHLNEHKPKKKKTEEEP